MISKFGMHLDYDGIAWRIFLLGDSDFAPNEEARYGWELPLWVDEEGNAVNELEIGGNITVVE